MGKIGSITIAEYEKLQSTLAKRANKQTHSYDIVRDPRIIDFPIGWVLHLGYNDLSKTGTPTET